jgi:hypothetical protein
MHRMRAAMDDGFLDADVAGFRDAAPDRAGGGGFEILRDEDTARAGSFPQLRPGGRMD